MRPTASLALATAAAAALAFAPTNTYFVEHASETVDARVFEPAGAMDHDCLEPVPDEVSTNAFTGGGNINLHVRLVLDTADARALDAVKDNPNTSVNERQKAINTRGQQIVRDFLAEGEQSYDEIDIDLDYASFDVLQAPDLKSGDRATTLEGTEAISLAKKQYGGKRPAGTDVVYVLSDRDLTSGGRSSLAGLADCIGGIHHPSRAFATGEFDPDAELSLGVTFYSEFTAKVAAHEIGHLMGAHHHYQACGHYAVSNYQAGYGAGACTLMTNLVDFVTFPFSPTNQAVVRGHAEEYAADNDAADGETEGTADGGSEHDGQDHDH